MKPNTAISIATVWVSLGLGWAHPSANAADAFSWGTVTMGGGGYVSAIITSHAEKNLLYARTDVGGAFRWDETKQAWICLTDWLGPDDMGLLGIDGLAIDPSHPNRLYMLAGTSYWNQGKTMIMRSEDYGQTFDTVNVTRQFKTHGNGYGRQVGERLVVDPNQGDVLFCGTRSDGLWKSQDRGKTWAQVSSFAKPTTGDGVGFVLFDTTHVGGGLAQRIYVGTLNKGSNLFVSEDAGATWNTLALPSLSRQLMPQRAVLTPKGRYLYMTMSDGSGPGYGEGTTIARGALLKYDTEAKTWENISPENLLDDPADPQNPGQVLADANLGGYGGLSMDAADSNHIIATTINKWTQQMWDSSNQSGYGDRIFVSSDGGQSWTSVFEKPKGEPAAPATGSDPIAVLGKNGFDWVEGESIHWAGSIEFDPFDSKRVFVTSGNGVYMTDNLAPGQRFIWKFTVKGLEETVPLDIVSIPEGPLVSVIGDYDGFVHGKITDPPTRRHLPKLGSNSGLAFAANKRNLLVRVGGNNNAPGSANYVFPIYYSQDTGKTWSKFATHPDAGQTYRGQVAVSLDGEVVLWNPEGKNTLYRTDNFGTTWTKATGATGYKMLPKADPFDANVFYVFNNGVMQSTDKGATFARVDNRSWKNFRDLQVTPDKSGHVWVAGVGDSGLTGGYLARSTDGGKTFTDVDPAQNSSAFTQKVDYCEALGFGKAAPGAAYPAIYIYGAIGGVLGMYQSVDEAKTWTRVDDALHRFGALANGGFVRGDMNTFGVVYRSTAGRGIAVRMPTEWKTSVSVRPRVGMTRRAAYPWKITGVARKLTFEPGAVVEAQLADLSGRIRISKKVKSGESLVNWVSRGGTYVLRLREVKIGQQQTLIMPIFP